MLCAEYCVEYCYCGSRNPLHGICGALEIIRAPDATPAVTSELLTAMQEGVDLMCTITNDLLDLEKLKCGKFVVKPTAVALRVLVETVASAARPACSGALTVAIDPRVPQTLLVDGQRLRQVLTNGLSNACKHAENVTLSVCVVASESAPPGAPRVLLRVLDDGTGLLGVDVTKLFDDFSAAASAVSMHGSVNGSGLGLPICGRLSQLMGGSLTVRDRPDGVAGVEFALSLPLVLPPAPTESKRVQRGSGSDIALNYIAATTIVVHAAPNGIQAEEEERSPPGQGPGDAGPASMPYTAAGADSEERGPLVTGRARADPRRPRIVVVDDSPLNRRIAERYVHALGYEAVLLTDGDEVADCIARAPCDIIMMDIRMARMDGDVACRMLRAGGYMGPIIAVRARARRSAAPRATPCAEPHDMSRSRGTK
jgi:two-component system, NarL family, capsular synthesis sensor histidine kinase RcsC